MENERTKGKGSNEEILSEFQKIKKFIDQFDIEYNRGKNNFDYNIASSAPVRDVFFSLRKGNTFIENEKKNIFQSSKMVKIEGNLQKNTREEDIARMLKNNAFYISNMHERERAIDAFLISFMKQSGIIVDDEDMKDFVETLNGNESSEIVRRKLENFRFKGSQKEKESFINTLTNIYNNKKRIREKSENYMYNEDNYAYFVDKAFSNVEKKYSNFEKIEDIFIKNNKDFFGDNLKAKKFSGIMKELVKKGIVDKDEAFSILGISEKYYQWDMKKINFFEPEETENVKKEALQDIFFMSSKKENDKKLKVLTEKVLNSDFGEELKKMGIDEKKFIDISKEYFSYFKEYNTKDNNHFFDDFKDYAKNYSNVYDIKTWKNFDNFIRKNSYALALIDNKKSQGNNKFVDTTSLFEMVTHNKEDFLTISKMLNINNFENKKDIEFKVNSYVSQILSYWEKDSYERIDKDFEKFAEAWKAENNYEDFPENKKKIIDTNLEKIKNRYKEKIFEEIEKLKQELPPLITERIERNYNSLNLGGKSADIDTEIKDKNFIEKLKNSKSSILQNLALVEEYKNKRENKVNLKGYEEERDLVFKTIRDSLKNLNRFKDFEDSFVELKKNALFYNEILSSDELLEVEQEKGNIEKRLIEDSLERFASEFSEEEKNVFLKSYEMGLRNNIEDNLRNGRYVEYVKDFDFLKKTNDLYNLSEIARSIYNDKNMDRDKLKIFFDDFISSSTMTKGQKKLFNNIIDKNFNFNLDNFKKNIAEKLDFPEDKHQRYEKINGYFSEKLANDIINDIVYEGIAPFPFKNPLRALGIINKMGYDFIDCVNSAKMPSSKMDTRASGISNCIDRFKNDIEQKGKEFKEALTSPYIGGNLGFLLVIMMIVQDTIKKHTIKEVNASILEKKKMMDIVENGEDEISKFYRFFCMKTNKEHSVNLQFDNFNDAEYHKMITNFESLEVEKEFLMSSGLLDNDIKNFFRETSIDAGNIDIFYTNEKFMNRVFSGNEDLLEKFYQTQKFERGKLVENLSILQKRLEEINEGLRKDQEKLKKLENSIRNGNKDGFMKNTEEIAEIQESIKNKKAELEKLLLKQDTLNEKIEEYSFLIKKDDLKKEVERYLHISNKKDSFDNFISLDFIEKRLLLYGITKQEIEDLKSGKIAINDLNIFKKEGNEYIFAKFYNARKEKHNNFIFAKNSQKFVNNFENFVTEKIKNKEIKKDKKIDTLLKTLKVWNFDLNMKNISQFYDISRKSAYEKLYQYNKDLLDENSPVKTYNILLNASKDLKKLNIASVSIKNNDLNDKIYKRDIDFILKTLEIASRKGIPVDSNSIKVSDLINNPDLKNAGLKTYIIQKKLETEYDKYKNNTISEIYKKIIEDYGLFKNKTLTNPENKEIFQFSQNKRYNEKERERQEHIQEIKEKFNEHREAFNEYRKEFFENKKDVEKDIKKVDDEKFIRLGNFEEMKRSNDERFMELENSGREKKGVKNAV